MSLTNIISLKQLYYTDFEIYNIFAMRQKWINGAVFHMQQPRKSTGIIFLNNVQASYVCKSHKNLVIKNKSVVCLPQGSEYTCFNIDCTETLNDAILLEINIKKDGVEFSFSDEPFIINDINILLIEKYFEDIIRYYESTKPSPIQHRLFLY